MRYIAIDAAKGTVDFLHIKVLDSDDNFQKALNKVGLKSHEVDFGGVPGTRRLNLVVYEYGLLEKPDSQHFFSLRDQLYAGSVLIHRFSDNGITIDCTEEDLQYLRNEVRFYADADAVEQAIQAGEVQRPNITIDGVPFWIWERHQSGERPFR